MSRVFVLGAGASAGYTGSYLGLTSPTAKGFFGTAQQVLRQGRLRDVAFHRLSHFLERFYGVSLFAPDVAELDIEEVLTVVDVERDFDVRHELLRLIVLTLNEVVYGEPCQDHKRLLDSLTDEDTVISFNWDLLVDNLLSLGRSNGPNYGTNALQMVSGGRPIRPSRRRGQVRFLKLHGSLNWMQCRRCRQSYAHILEGKMAAPYYRNEPVRCPTCQRETEPIIVPPTLIKHYSQRVLRAMWAEAEYVLREATEVTVVGYSLPVTDFRAKWLFMKASARRAEPLRELTLVDINPKPLKAKFSRAFRVPSRAVKTITGGIKDVPC